MTANTAITLRPATLEDADLLLDWANDEEVRRASFNSDPIGRDGHIVWLTGKLSDSSVAFFIAEADGAPIGYSRLERGETGDAEIAVSVNASARGHGLGRRLISLASAVGRRELGASTVSAKVKTENEASVRAFRAAGFADEHASLGDGSLRLVQRALPTVPHSRPFVGDAEARAAAEVVLSGRLAQGPVVDDLERRWRELTGMSAAACVGSGVAALRLALHAVGVGPGDEVIVPAYSCVALLNAPLALGATPILADVDLDRWTLSADDVARRVTSRTRAIVAVDLFGEPAPLQALAQIGPPVIEDCAHGIGGTTDAGPFGGGSDISIASFYATKMLGAGEGGIVAARDPSVIDRVRFARDYGDRLADARHLNDKLTDVIAAIAREQVKRLTDILERRAERSATYAERLAGLAADGAVILPPDDPGRIWYRYAVRLTGHQASDVCVRASTLGVHLEQPVWDLRDAPQWSADYRNTATAFDRVVSLPLYPDLSAHQLDMVVDTLVQVLLEG